MTSKSAGLIIAAGLCALTACGKKQVGEEAVVARVGGQAITVAELKRRLDEVSPAMRARYATAEHKKEFLENLIRNELLAQEAEREGLDKSPAAREQQKRAMVQELIKRRLDDRMSGADLTDAELKKFYDAHAEEFVKPERVRAFHIFLPAHDAQARAEAKKRAAGLLHEIDARERKGELNAFQSVALKESKDALSSPMGGDLRFLSREELAKAYSRELAEAVFALKDPGQKVGPLEVPGGVEVIKLQLRTPALSRRFDESKESIRGRLARDRRSHEYDDWMKNLRVAGKVTIDEAELAQVRVDAVPQQHASAAVPPKSGRN